MSFFDYHRGNESARPAVSPDTAARRIDEVCQAAIDGRAAGRALALWLARFQFGESEFHVLWRLHLGPTDGLDQKTLAASLALSPAQISATVERVRTRGWIVQRTPAGDRRRNLWQLTSAGHDLVGQMLTAAAELRYEHAIHEHAAFDPPREAAA